MDAHTKPMFSMFLLLSGALMVVILYYYAYPMWAGLGLRSHFTDSLMLTLYRSGSFRNQYAVRGVCLFFCAIAVVVRSGRSQNAPWVSIIVPLGMGLILFFTAPLMGNRWVFVLATFVGFVLFFAGRHCSSHSLHSGKHPSAFLHACRFAMQ